MEKIIEPNIILIIPCYNEAKRLDKNLFVNFSESYPNVSICFVNDGSTDETPNIIEDIIQNCSNFHSLHLKNNVGKAEAVRQGFLYSNEKFSSKYMGYFDADLSTPLKYHQKLKEEFEEYPEAIMVFGSRQLANPADIERRNRRHLAGRFVSILINYHLDLHFEDTQCGAKLFKTEYVPQLFKDPFNSTWIFDVEIIHRLRKLKPNEAIYNIAREIPVSSWRDVGDSKVSPFYFFKLLRELGKIRWS